MHLSRYDVQKALPHGITARGIAEPLPSFDDTATASVVCAIMVRRGSNFAAVRREGLISGYIIQAELGERPCRDFAHPFDDAAALPQCCRSAAADYAADRSDPGAEPVTLGLRPQPGPDRRVVTRADLQDLPVRIWFPIDRRPPRASRSLVPRRTTQSRVHVKADRVGSDREAVKLEALSGGCSP
jgi:hypothetical protein